jgi:hypothetical protein
MLGTVVFQLSFGNSAINFRAAMLRAVAKHFQFFVISFKKAALDRITQAYLAAHVVDRSMLHIRPI